MYIAPVKSQLEVLQQGCRSKPGQSSCKAQNSTTRFVMLHPWTKLVIWLKTGQKYHVTRTL